MSQRRPIIFFLKNPGKIFRSLAMRGWFKWMPDRMFLKLIYHGETGKRLDLKNPALFNEKLQWLKLYDRRPEYTTMVDKYAVKKYISDTIGIEYVIPTLGVWERAEDINFEVLPNQFVLKTNHDSSGVVICNDKSKLDIAQTISFLNKHLSVNGYWHGREWPYKNVKPRIIAEPYLEDTATKELRDYKLFAFNGEVKAFYITSGRKAGDRRTDFFDMDMHHLDIQDDDPNAETAPAIPQNFQRMKEIAEQLSKGIPHLRVDFYEIDGKVYVGELTFYYLCGFVPFKPEKWNEIFGEWIDLSIVSKKRSK